MDLGYHVFVLSTQSPNIEKTRPILYATVLVLLAADVRAELRRHSHPRPGAQEAARARLTQYRLCRTPFSRKSRCADAARPPARPAAQPLIEIENLSLYYGAARALKDVTLTIRERVVTAFIGPSGCGKSTLLRCLNRMNDLIDSVRIEGSVRIGGHDIYRAGRGRHRVAQARGHGVPEIEPVPEIDLRQRRLRSAPARNEEPDGTGRGGGAKPAQRRVVGRGQGPAALRARSGCPAGSSSGSASRAPSPSSRRSSSWTSRPPRSIPSPPRASRT